MTTASETAVTPILPTPYARQPVRRRVSARRWLVVAAVIVCVFAGALLALWRLGVVARVTGSTTSSTAVHIVAPTELAIMLIEDGELKPKKSIDIKCEVEGQTTIRTVIEESKRIKKGDLLIELASDAIQERVEQEELQVRTLRAALKAAQDSREITNSENESNLQKAIIELKVAELDLKKYIKGDYEASKKQIAIDIQQTNNEIARKQDDLEKNLPLRRRGFVTQAQIDQIEFDLKRLQMLLEKHELAMVVLENYEKPKALSQKDSAVARAREELERARKQAAARASQAIEKVNEQQDLLNNREKRLARLREQLAKCRIEAPVDGIVQYPSNDWGWGSNNRIVPGEKVYESQTLIVLPDTSQMTVTTRIHEADRHKVQEGMECVVTVPAVPGRRFTGKIARIAKFADSAHRWLNPELKEHATEILLDETDALLSPGDSAEVKILIDTIPDALAVPVQSVFARGTRSFVFRKDGGSFEPTEVKLGRASTTMIEVKEGLAANDQVLMQADEELLARLPAFSPTGSWSEDKEPGVKAGAPPRSAGDGGQAGAAQATAAKSAEPTKTEPAGDTKSQTAAAAKAEGDAPKASTGANSAATTGGAANANTAGTSSSGPSAEKKADQKPAQQKSSDR